MEALELALFRSRQGVSQAEVLEASQQLSRWLQRQSGFLYRSLSQQEDGLWVDVVYWQSLEQAQAASAGFMQASESQALMALIEPDSVHLSHSQIAYRLEGTMRDSGAA